MSGFLAIILAPFLLCRVASALEFSPFYGIEQKRDTNIYLTQDNPASAWINVSSAGFSLSHRRDALSLDASYGIGLFSYSKDKAANDYVGHDAYAALGLRPEGQLSFSLSDRYLVTTDPAESEQTRRLKRGQNLADGEIQAKLPGGFGLFVRGTALKQDYFVSAGEAMSRSEYAVRSGLQYTLYGDLRVFAGYERGVIGYVSDSVRDSNYNQPVAGIEGALTEGVTVYAEANVQRREYKNSLSAGGYTAQDKTSTVGGRFELRWQANPDTLARLAVLRANRESEQALSRYYVSTLAELGITQRVAGFSLEGGSGLEFLDSPEVTPSTGSKRKNGDFFARAGLSYEFARAFTAGASFLSRNRTSNESGLGFSDLVYSFFLKGRF